MTQQLSGNIGEIASLTMSQDNPPKPQPGRLTLRRPIRTGILGSATHRNPTGLLQPS